MGAIIYCILMFLFVLVCAVLFIVQGNMICSLLMGFCLGIWIYFITYAIKRYRKNKRKKKHTDFDDYW